MPEISTSKPLFLGFFGFLVSFHVHGFGFCFGGFFRFFKFFKFFGGGLLWGFDFDFLVSFCFCFSLVFL